MPYEVVPFDKSSVLLAPYIVITISFSTLPPHDYFVIANLYILIPSPFSACIIRWSLTGVNQEPWKGPLKPIIQVQDEGNINAASVKHARVKFVRSVRILGNVCAHQ